MSVCLPVYLLACLAVLRHYAWKKMREPNFLKYSPCPKMGQFYPNFGLKNLFPLFLESALRVFFNLCMTMRHYSYIKIIEWNSPKYFPWVNGRFGLHLAQNYEIIYLSIHSKYFFGNFAVWYRKIGRQNWFNFAQESFNFSKSTAPLALFMLSLN